MCGLIKTNSEINVLREGGFIASEIFSHLKEEVVEGNDSVSLDKYAEYLLKKYKVQSAFKGYNGYKFNICANLNEVVVHGIPNKIKFKSGDIFGLDFGIIYRGYYLDMSATIEIGETKPEVHNFVQKTLQSMNQGVSAAITSNTIGDITNAMRKNLVDEKFQLMKDFVGHGIGKRLHEIPEIPGDGVSPHHDLKIVPGMVLAIEAISVFGPTNNYQILEDGWTVVTEGMKYLSALFEVTIVVNDDYPEILTPLYL